MTPDEENELICTKLLGWERRQLKSGTAVTSSIWIDAQGRWRSNPDFDSWEFAGKILDAMLEKGRGIHTTDKPVIEIKYNHISGNWWCGRFNGNRTSHYSGDTGPLAIRAAALAYLTET